MSQFELDQEEDFEALFAEFGGGDEQLAPRVGSRVKGHIVSMDNEFAFVALGGKSEGVIPNEELLDRDGTPRFSVGDEIEAKVASTGGKDGVMRLSFRSLKASLDMELLEDAFANRLSVEGKVTSRNKGGYVVSIGGKEAFCPISQIELGFTHNEEAHIGCTYAFRITELQNGRFVVSRAQLLREEKEERIQELRGTLRVGDRVSGIVDSFRDFGAFIDLDGLQGLVHVSQVSWTRVNHPSEVLEIGQRVEAKVTELDWSRERIGLSIRDAEGDPWENLALQVGDRKTGKVTRVADFGVFLEIAHGVEGLLHRNDISWTGKARRPSDMFKAGDASDVVVLDINRLEKRISLGLKQLEADPWAAIATRFRAGQRVTGTVEKVADFGVFLQLEEGLTGLIPNRELAEERVTHPSRSFPVGTALEVVILEVDSARRRISLSRKAALLSGEDEFPGGMLGEQGNGLGTFADLFKGKL